MARRVAVPKPKKRAEKPKDVEVIEISSDSDEERGLVAVQEKKAAAAAPKKKTAVSYTSVLTARSKVKTFLDFDDSFHGLNQSDSESFRLLLLFRLLVVWRRGRKKRLLISILLMLRMTLQLLSMWKISTASTSLLRLVLYLLFMNSFLV